MNALSVIKSIPKSITKTSGKILMNLSRNKPQLMLGSGAILAIGGFVWAVISAQKIQDVTMDSEGTVEYWEEVKANPEGMDKPDATPEDCDKEIKKAKKKAIIDLCKLMGIPCLVFAGGLILMIGGHKILLRRFSELTTAYAWLQKSYDRYRQLNIKEHGEECDRRYQYGIVGTETVETQVTDEKGKTKTIKEDIPVVDLDKAAGLYTFEFSENFSSRCPRDPVNTISFLRTQERYWNTWMETTGKPVTLYMVLNDLGIDLDPDDPRNDYILEVGWRPNGTGDNKIDFGIMRAVNKPAIDMLENVVLLNFNCDGVLYHAPRFNRDGRRITDEAFRPVRRQKRRGE